MSRISKYSFETKLETIKSILNGELTIPRAAQILSCNAKTIRAWKRLYLNVGESALKNSVKNRHYSVSFKKKVVEEYLNNSLSYYELTEKYKIPSRSVVKQWVIHYNNLKSPKSKSQGIFRLTLDEINWKSEEVMMITKMKFDTVTGIIENNYGYDLKEGESIYKAKGRNTEYIERLIMAFCCIMCGYNYEEIIRKCGVSYSQIRKWTKDLEEKKYNALVDKRGQKTELSEKEKLELENSVLRAKCYYLERLNDHIKKLN